MNAKVRHLPYLIALITVALALFLEAEGVRFGAGLPLGWGLIKDFIDPILVVLFPWNGWVFLAPLSLALLFRWSWTELTILWIASSLVMGIGVTVVLFDQVTISRCMNGVGFYALVFGVTWGAGQFVFWIFGRINKWRQ